MVVEDKIFSYLRGLEEGIRRNYVQGRTSQRLDV
jgi:hypothetical protein